MKLSLALLCVAAVVHTGVGVSPVPQDIYGLRLACQTMRQKYPQFSPVDLLGLEFPRSEVQTRQAVPYSFGLIGQVGNNDNALVGQRALENNGFIFQVGNFDRGFIRQDGLVNAGVAFSEGVGNKAGFLQTGLANSQAIVPAGPFSLGPYTGAFTGVLRQLPYLKYDFLPGNNAIIGQIGDFKNAQVFQNMRGGRSPVSTSLGLIAQTGNNDYALIRQRALANAGFEFQSGNLDSATIGQEGLVNSGVSFSTGFGNTRGFDQIGLANSQALVPSGYYSGLAPSFRRVAELAKFNMAPWEGNLAFIGQFNDNSRAKILQNV